jgi:hypothetical protein
MRQTFVEIRAYADKLNELMREARAHSEAAGHAKLDWGGQAQRAGAVMVLHTAIMQLKRILMAYM